MKNIKTLPKKIGRTLNNKTLTLSILLCTILIGSNSYSKNIFKNYKNEIMITETNCLDTIKKRKDVTLQQQKNNDRLIIKLNELEKLAEFPGVMKKFYKKVSANLDASELNYTGFTQIHVSFIIEKDGSMSEIVVDSSLDSELKKEIIIGLKSIKTKWLPATLDNKPIRIEYSLPIVLNIE
jgi:hypothetical protein